ncbi:hypothetical protein CFBP5875_04575 [Agrobacterium pusense]|uniref:hypothetical protein n=1 Tax=Agrobacterium pusense TaxID=648995 RepID=UPI0010BF047E|nr:hypothetical protein [Agrobacterium pusense]QCL83893.1 hypothetical protein CFBP5875_04575 [Agrobacterium pusense]
MNRRKGELTASAIDRGWPHQIALRESLSSGKRWMEMMEFCQKNRLMRCDRGHSVFFEDEHYNVHCFATKQGAEAFLEKYGGEWFDPRDRGKGLDWNKWYKGRAGRRA